jgi:nitrogenase iron protein NifH
MRKIALYGKGGIGKSTIATHLAAAWAELGFSVMLIGCDPKADSTRPLLGRRSPTLLDNYEKMLATAETKAKASALNSLIEVGYAGVKCVEIGGPNPGVGCAGRGISLALELLDNLKAFEALDYVVFDILGDVVCGGFATPMRMGFAEEVYIVTSGEYAALYAANSICTGIRNMGSELGGIIANCRGLPDEIHQVSEFARAVGSSLVGSLPRSALFPRCELMRKTVLEAEPKCQEAEIVRTLSQAIRYNEALSVPMPLSEQDLEDLALATMKASAEMSH